MKRLGADGSLFTIAPYDLPHQWSAAVHAHPDRVDGFVYMSKHLNTRRAVVLFDRTDGKLCAVRYTGLASYPGIWQVKRTLGVQIKWT